MGINKAINTHLGISNGAKRNHVIMIMIMIMSNKNAKPNLIICNNAKANTMIMRKKANLNIIMGYQCYHLAAKNHPTKNQYNSTIVRVKKMLEFS